MRMSYIGHLWIPVSNLKKSLEFYLDKLGLVKGLESDLSDVSQAKINNKFAVLATKDIKTVIILVEDKNLSSIRTGRTGGVIVGWVVDNLDQTRQAFTKKGVEFVGDIIDFGDRKLINFRDLDDHIFQLAEITEKI